MAPSMEYVCMIIISPPGEVHSIVITVSVCLYLCVHLYVCPLAYLKNPASKLHEIYCVACGLGLVFL